MSQDFSPEVRLPVGTRGAIAEGEHATPVDLLSAANNALGVVYKDAGRHAEAADRYAAAWPRPRTPI